MKLTLGNQEIEITEEQRRQFIEALNPTKSCSLNSSEKADSWPQQGDGYYTVYDTGHIEWIGDFTDKRALALGLAFQTEKEAKAHVRYLKALTRVKGSSSFVPDWSLSNVKQQKFFVRYMHDINKLAIAGTYYSQYIGTPVFYESQEAAEQAIKDHKEDFLILAGVK